MIIKYIPEPCQEGVLFSGHVMMRKISMPEKLEAAKKYSSIDPGDVEKIRDMIEWSKQFVTKVAIKNENDGCEYKTFDDLMADGETMEVLSDIASALIMGPGKKKTLVLKS